VLEGFVEVDAIPVTVVFSVASFDGSLYGVTDNFTTLEVYLSLGFCKKKYPYIQSKRYAKIESIVQKDCIKLSSR
jgi:hypothetical protein